MAHEPEDDPWLAALTVRLRRHYSADEVDACAAHDRLNNRLRTLAADLRGDEPRYRSAGELDRGGMGRILLAHDRALARRVALKQASTAADKAQHGLRLLAESAIIAELQHPGVVPIHDVGIDDDGAPFFVMPHIEGHSLADALTDDPTAWPLTRRAETVRRVAETMAYAHSVGIAHRDLKPGNVMLGAFGEVYVMDWGLGRHLHTSSPPERTEHVGDDHDPALTMAGSILGTPAYLAPERAQSDHAIDDPTTLIAGDIYAVGAMLYELLSGQPPYLSERENWSVEDLLQTIAERPPAPLHARHEPELVAICERAMHRDAAQRYPSMSAIADDLRAWSEHRIVSAHGASTLRRVSKWTRRNRGLALVLVVAITSLIAITATFVVHLSEARDEAVQSLRELTDLAVIQQVADLKNRAEEQLWPAEVRYVDAMQKWINEAASLHENLERLRARRQALAVANDSESVWRERLLDDAIAALEGLFATPGLSHARVPAQATLTTMRQRIRAAHELARASLEQPSSREAWRQAREYARAEPRYRDVSLEPMAGFVPLGPDPDTGLLEFAHLHTGEPPTRDAGGKLRQDGSTGLVFVLLPGGTFTMGASPTHATNRDRMSEVINEQPVHQVTLAPFLISKFEMTQGQWRRARGDEPSVHRGNSIYVEEELADCHPVESVDWWTARATMVVLGLRLPSEAQWEYAARAGTSTPWHVGGQLADLLSPPAGNLADASSANALGAQGWVATEGLDDGYVMHAPVGSFAPNAFGLHDVLGNVWEWCEEEYVSYQKPAGEGHGRRARSENPGTVMYRGGGFDQPAAEARSANRAGARPTRRHFSIGLRPVRMWRQR